MAAVVFVGLGVVGAGLVELVGASRDGPSRTRVDESSARGRPLKSHTPTLLQRHRVATSHRFAVATAGLLLFVASAAQAQESMAQAQERRSGFWLGLGAGSGWDITDSSFNVLNKKPKGVAAVIRAGGTLTPQVLFGVEVLWRELARGDTTPFRGNGTFTMQVFPDPTGALFIKGGVGLAFFGERLGRGSGTHTVGLGLTAGVGLDLRLLGNLYLTPSLDYLRQSFDAGGNLRRVHRLLVGTIGLTWH